MRVWTRQHAAKRLGSLPPYGFVSGPAAWLIDLRYCKYYVFCIFVLEVEL